MIIRHLPLNTVRASEALRAAVGYTLAPQRVTALLVEDGVYAARSNLKPDVAGQPELLKHIQTLKALGHRLVADRPSYEERGSFPLHQEIELLDREQVFKLLEESDVVVPY